MVANSYTDIWLVYQKNRPEREQQKRKKLKRYYILYIKIKKNGKVILQGRGSDKT